MLHPGAQRSEHRIKAPACRETQQAGTVTTSWQSGRQHGARPQHHLGISLRLAPTQHNHCISSRQNNLKSLSEKRGEDHCRHTGVCRKRYLTFNSFDLGDTWIGKVRSSPRISLVRPQAEP